MVAVVVILAAVIGAFVLGLGGSQTETPQASFSFDQQTGTLTMTGGDNLANANIEVVTSGGGSVNQFTEDTISAGNTASVTGTADGDTITVNWAPPDSGDSATLWQTTV